MSILNNKERDTLRGYLEQMMLIYKDDQGSFWKMLILALDDSSRCAKLEDTIRAVLDVKEDKSLGWFWLEQALKGNFER